MRSVLFADPKTTWNVPEESLRGVTFELRSGIELETLSREFPKEFGEIADTAPRIVERSTRVSAAAGYRRTDEIGNKKTVAAAFALAWTSASYRPECRRRYARRARLATYSRARPAYFAARSGIPAAVK